MRKLSTALALIPLFATGTGALFETPAGAYTTYLCKSADYRCTVGGYNASTVKRTGWAWRFYGGTWPSYNTYGPHNCTLYAAYRLEREGITLNWHANGSDWARVGAANGIKVDANPTVGSIAQWFLHHETIADEVRKLAEPFPSLHREYSSGQSTGQAPHEHRPQQSTHHRQAKDESLAQTLEHFLHLFMDEVDGLQWANHHLEL